MFVVYSVVIFYSLSLNISRIMDEIPSESSLSSLAKALSSVAADY
jgi:hypothetical protein